MASFRRRQGFLSNCLARHNPLGKNKLQHWLRKRGRKQRTGGEKKNPTCSNPSWLWKKKVKIIRSGREGGGKKHRYSTSARTEVELLNGRPILPFRGLKEREVSMLRREKKKKKRGEKKTNLAGYLSEEKRNKTGKL